MFENRMTERGCNMAGLTYVPAEQMRELICLHRIEPFRLINVGSELMAQLELTRLNLVFEIEGFRPSASSILDEWVDEEKEIRSIVSRFIAGMVSLILVLTALQWAGVAGL